MKPKALSRLAFSMLLCCGTAHSQTFTYFKFAEKGMVGELIVLNERSTSAPVQPIVMSVLSGDQKTQHICEFRAMEITAARIKAARELVVTLQVVDEDKKPVQGAQFDAVFRSDAVVLSGAPNGFCGMSASYSGRWRRTAAPK